MSDNIIQFPGGDETPPEHIILICPECGCSTWYLDLRPALCCANCGTNVEPSRAPEWRRLVPERPAVPLDQLELSTGAGAILDWRDETFARRRVISNIQGWNDDKTLLYVAGVREDGNLTTWCYAKTALVRDYIVNRLETAINSLKSTTFRSETDEPENNDE